MTTSLIILAIIIFLAIFAISSYNSLISLKTKVKEAESDIDVQLKRRYDLIPNLVETVKGYAKFESETLEKVVQARNSAMSVSGLGDDRAAAETALSSSLKSVFALAESYPDLKANTSFVELQRELTNTEDRVLSSRRFYNQVVGDYNIIQDQFPTMLFKGLAGAAPAKFFELENPTEERKNIKVSF
jgi:LemA protein